MNTLRALRPFFTLLLCITLPGCGGDPPADATSIDASRTSDTSGTSGTSGDLTTSGPDPEGEGTGTTEPGTMGTSGGASSSSSGEDSTGAGTNEGEPVILGNIKSCPVSGKARPTLPEEAGQLAATVLTPDAYPFEVSRVAYAMVRDLDDDCVSTFAHRVEVFVIDGDKPPANPSTEASTFVSIAIEESLEDVALRIVEPELDPPIVLEDGQSVVVAISLDADVDASVSLCLDSCVGDATPGVDFWSYAAAEPYNWTVLTWPANFTIYAVGRAL